MDAEEGLDKDEPLLVAHPEALLIAALIAKDYLPNYSDNKAKIAKHRELALDWLDWAVCESDLGRALAEAKAQAALKRKKPDDGTIIIGPYGI